MNGIDPKGLVKYIYNNVAANYAVQERKKTMGKKRVFEGWSESEEVARWKILDNRINLLFLDIITFFCNHKHSKKQKKYRITIEEMKERKK